MDSLFKLLDLIREKPLLYLGRRSLISLRSFIDGWLLRSPQDPVDFHLFQEFQPWMSAKYGQPYTISWDRILQAFSSDDAAALDTFFSLMDEYRLTLPAEFHPQQPNTRVDCSRLPKFGNSEG